MTDEQRTALGGWVKAKLERTYGIGVPSCWRRHPGLAATLAAVHLAWVGAYEAPARRHQDAADWHARYLPLVEKTARASSRCDHAVEVDPQWPDR